MVVGINKWMEEPLTEHCYDSWRLKCKYMEVRRWVRNHVLHTSYKCNHESPFISNDDWCRNREWEAK